MRANGDMSPAAVLLRNEVLGSYAIAYSTPGALEVVDFSYNPSPPTKRCQRTFY